MRLRARDVLVGVIAVAAVAACSSDDVPDDQIIVPLESAPDGWVESSFDGMTVTTPAGWEQSEVPEEEQDAVSHVFQADFNDHGTRGGLGVIVAGEPESSAAAAAEGIEVNYGAVVEIVSDVVREEIVWPGAEDAWFVEFTADLSNDEGERAPHIIQHLVLDLEDGTQIQANVTGLESDFDAQSYGEALASLSVS